MLLNSNWQLVEQNSVGDSIGTHYLPHCGTLMVLLHSRVSKSNSRVIDLKTMTWSQNDDLSPDKEKENGCWSIVVALRCAKCRVVLVALHPEREVVYLLKKGLKKKLQIKIMLLDYWCLASSLLCCMWTTWDLVQNQRLLNIWSTMIKSIDDCIQGTQPDDADPMYPTLTCIGLTCDPPLISGLLIYQMQPRR